MLAPCAHADTRAAAPRVERAGGREEVWRWRHAAGHVEDHGALDTLGAVGNVEVAASGAAMRDAADNVRLWQCGDVINYANDGTPRKSKRCRAGLAGGRATRSGSEARIREWCPWVRSAPVQPKLVFHRCVRAWPCGRPRNMSIA
eukprot:6189242-Pleurochrysis_carterae.AAC.2